MAILEELQEFSRDLEEQIAADTETAKLYEKKTREKMEVQAAIKSLISSIEESGVDSNKDVSELLAEMKQKVADATERREKSKQYASGEVPDDVAGAMPSAAPVETEPAPEEVATTTADEVFGVGSALGE